MLQSLTKFLKSGFMNGDTDSAASSSSQSTKSHAHKDFEIAAAVLLIETAMTEHHFGNEEQMVIEQLLRSRFDLSESELASLMELGQAKQADAVELHRFTNVLKKQFSEEERIQILEMIWEVAYADGILHDYEAHLARRIGGLIHVSDRDRGDARKRVLARLELSDQP